MSIGPAGGLCQCSSAGGRKGTANEPLRHEGTKIPSLLLVFVVNKRLTVKSKGDEMASSHRPIPAEVEAVAKHVVDAALRVHKALGPGLLESVYETCLCHELHKRKLACRRQVDLPVVYDGIRLNAGLRLDLLVGDCLIVELKAVEKHNPLFEAQLLSYLKLTGHRLGLLINFNVPVLKNGLKRIIL